jgi:mono/diheme cytochrome c family protein
MKIRLRTIGIALLFAAAAAGMFMYAGLYNVAATRQHIAPVYWLLDYAMRRSVRHYSSRVEVPDLSDTGRVRNGFHHYRSQCLRCHGAPGVSPDDLGFGMNPAPANLVATAREWHAAEIYWVVKNGIKMSGMPAWEYRMSDREIWDVVAFVKHLPALSPKEYEAWNTATQPPLLTKAPPVSGGGGDAEAGRRALGQYLCATCHQIPGVTGANRHVGPPLNGMGTRKYIAGVLPNTPENMMRWLQDPKQVDPLSAMPNLGVKVKDARDMAAYLATLTSLK